MPKITKPTSRWDADRRCLHIEAPGAIINIRVGIRGNGNSADVTHVEIIPDGDRYAGERPWWLDDDPQCAAAIHRIVRRDA